MASKRIPGFYLQTKKRYPDFFDALEALGEAARAAGPLDAKTVRLIQLAAAAAVRSEGSVHSHARRAVEAGATPEEICHAIIAVTSTIGFPSVSAAMSWVDDVLKDGGARTPRR